MESGCGWEERARLTLRGMAKMIWRKSKFEEKIIIPTLYMLNFTTRGPSRWEAVVYVGLEPSREVKVKTRNSPVYWWLKPQDWWEDQGRGRRVWREPRKGPRGMPSYQDSQRSRNRRRGARKAHSLRTEGRENFKKGSVIRIKDHREVTWDVLCMWQVDILRKWPS